MRTYDPITFSYDPIEEYIEKRHQDFMLSILRGYFSALDPRTRAIIKARYIVDGKLTRKELGLAYGISVTRVDQIAQKGFRRLRYLCSQLDL